MHKVPAKLGSSYQSKLLIKKMAAHFSFLQMDSMGMPISCAVPCPTILFRWRARSPQEIYIRAIPTRLQALRPELARWLPRFCEASLRSVLELHMGGTLSVVSSV